MSKAPIFPIAVNIYHSETHHLSTEQHGAYLLLMFRIWSSNCRGIPDRDSVLSMTTKLSRHKWLKHRPVLEEFFRIEDDKWYHDKLEEYWKKIVGKKNEQKPPQNTKPERKHYQSAMVRF